MKKYDILLHASEQFAIYILWESNQEKPYQAGLAALHSLVF